MKVFYVFFIAFISCKQQPKNNFDSVEKEQIEASNADNKVESQSFVISCGSGCAMTYYQEQVISKGLLSEVIFKVEIYINEVISDEYFETYIFQCNENGEVVKINLKGENDNILESKLPEMQSNFEEYGNTLCSKKETANAVKLSNTCIVTSNFKLPYDKKIDVNSTKYNILECKTISGIDKFLCNEISLRYISLPSPPSIKVILVPMDCADFNYRFYLLTIFNNKVISSEYVEGEWYEPGDDSYKETTSFTINNNFVITVKTKIIENGKTNIKEEINFKISEIGKLIKE